MDKQLNPIVVQGPMDIEIEYLLKKLSHVEEINIGTYKFYKGDINEYPVIISKTGVGIINTSVATTIAIQEFKPTAIINQGIAGAHMCDIHINDIIIGEKAVNINSFEVPFREEGEGSQPFEWEESTWVSISSKCDEGLLEITKNIKYKNGKIYYGTIGSGDIWNKEIDRINWLHQKYNTLCEEMESVATYTVCNNFDIPCLGIRIISNNEINKERYDENTAITIQKFVLDFLAALQKNLQYEYFNNFYS